jgi:hypothetical protein
MPDPDHLLLTQIEQGRHLRRQGAAQVEVALVLTVAVRSGPVKTVVKTR